MALDLGEYVKPDLLLTVTYPGDWREVAGSGPRTKGHLRALRQWIDRQLKARGITDWGALWFLEFQTRGAPHFHLVLWGTNLRGIDLDEVKPALSKAWVKIVDHPDPEQRAKHLQAGTRLEFLRERHFGYAVAYASKPHQKQVPEGYAKPGRFWGTWNADIPEPIVFRTVVPFASFEHLVNQLTVAVTQHSPGFAAKVRERTADIVERGWPTAVRLYGKESVEVALTTELDGQPPP
jgi:hypothetical protein